MHLERCLSAVPSTQWLSKSQPRLLRKSKCFSDSVPMCPYRAVPSCSRCLCRSWYTRMWRWGHNQWHVHLSSSDDIPRRKQSFHSWGCDGRRTQLDRPRHRASPTILHSWFSSWDSLSISQCKMFVECWEGLLMLLDPRRTNRVLLALGTFQFRSALRSSPNRKLPMLTRIMLNGPSEQIQWGRQAFGSPLKLLCHICRFVSAFSLNSYRRLYMAISSQAQSYPSCYLLA